MGVRLPVVEGYITCTAQFCRYGHGVAYNALFVYVLVKEFNSLSQCRSITYALTCVLLQTISLKRIESQSPKLTTLPRLNMPPSSFSSAHLEMRGGLTVPVGCKTSVTLCIRTLSFKPMPHKGPLLCGGPIPRCWLLVALSWLQVQYFTDPYR